MPAFIPVVDAMRMAAPGLAVVVAEAAWSGLHWSSTMDTGAAYLEISEGELFVALEYDDGWLRVQRAGVPDFGCRFRLQREWPPTLARPLHRHARTALRAQNLVVSFRHSQGPLREDSPRREMGSARPGIYCKGSRALT